MKREAATGDDCLLGATPGSDAVELGLQVAIFYRRPQAHCTSVVLIRRLLAGTLVQGHMQAHEMRCAAEGNRLMSMPTSETMTCALRSLMPGIDMISSTAVRKGPRLAST